MCATVTLARGPLARGGGVTVGGPWPSGVADLPGHGRLCSGSAPFCVSTQFKRALSLLKKDAGKVHFRTFNKTFFGNYYVFVENTQVPN